MRIKSIRVKNFRCLEDVRVDMETLTSFVGPNGAGKSTVLRALDWFFNGETRLVDEDVYSGQSRTGGLASRSSSPISALWIAKPSGRLTLPRLHDLHGLANLG